MFGIGNKSEPTANSFQSAASAMPQSFPIAPPNNSYGVNPGVSPQQLAQPVPFNQSPEINAQSAVLNFEQLSPKIQNTFKHLSANEKKEIKGYNLSNERTIIMMTGKAAHKTLFPGPIRRFFGALNPFSHKPHKEVDKMLKESGITKARMGELRKSMAMNKTYVQVEMSNINPETQKETKHPSLIDVTMTESPHIFYENKSLLFRKDIQQIFKETETAIKSIVSSPEELQYFNQFFDAYNKKDMKFLNEFFQQVEGHTYTLNRLDMKSGLIPVSDVIENIADGVVDSQMGKPSTMFILGNSYRTQFSNQKFTTSASLPLPTGGVQAGAMTMISNSKPNLIDMFLSSLVFSMWGKGSKQIPKAEIKDVAEAMIANVKSMEASMHTQSIGLGNRVHREAPGALNGITGGPSKMLGEREEKSGPFAFLRGGK